MKIEGDYVFDGPMNEVWNLVRDPDVLVSALPGAQSMQQVSETEYEGKMNVRVGPVSGVFAGRLEVKDEVPPESFALEVQGRGAPGYLTGSGAVQLVDQGDGTTLMKYQGDVEIGGKLAGVGQRLMDSVSKSIIRQGLESMDQVLQARLAPKPVAEQVESRVIAAPAKSAEAHRPPSEAQFAATVARDVVKDLTADLLTPENQTALMVAAVAIVSMVVGFLLGRGCRNRD